MLYLKQTLQPNRKKSGFTIIELMVVITIMAILATVLVMSYNQSSSARNVRLAASVLGTTVREVQSNSSASKNNTATGQPNKFALIGFTTTAAGAANTSYNNRSVDTAYTMSLEKTTTLPQNVRVTSLRVGRTLANMSVVSCVEVIYAPPFTKSYMYSRTDGNTCASTIQSSTLLSTPGQLITYSDLILQIDLTDDSGANIRTVTINGVTGAVTSQ